MNININFKEKTIRVKKYNGNFYSFLDRLREMLGEDLSGWKLEIGKRKTKTKTNKKSISPFALQTLGDSILANPPYPIQVYYTNTQSVKD